MEKIEGKKSLLNGRVSLDPEEFQQLKTGAQKYVAYRRKDNKLQALLDAANEKIAQLTASNTYWEQQAQEKDRTISHLQNALAARESVKERLDRNALQQENRSLKQELLQLKELLHRHGIAAEHTVPKQYIKCQ